MSVSSSQKKVKQKGVVRELKLVETISRNGKDTIQTEEVKTRGRSLQNPSLKNLPSRSSSPIKRRKLEDFEEELAYYDLEGLDISNKRKTLVFIFQLL